MFTIFRVIFFAHQNPLIFIVASFNCIFKNQIFEINSVFVVRRLRVILTLLFCSLLTGNTEVAKVVVIWSPNDSDITNPVATRTLAQASEVRLSEVVMKFTRVKRDFSSRRGVLWVWANQGLAQAIRSRLSEMSWSSWMCCLHCSLGEIELGVWASDGLA